MLIGETSTTCVQGREPPAALRELLEDHPVRGGLVGRSALIRALFDRIQRLATSDLPVLIRGEEGTEIDGVAHALHWNSDRSGRPLVVERAASLRQPHDLRQLFGHARGAFPGASAAVPGILGEADGGTLFLEEIGDLPPATQGCLVRALETGEYRPIGAAAVRRSDFRLVVSSTTDVEGLVAAGALRRDLYFRMRGAFVTIPPLRERKSDIPLLAEHVLAEEARRRGRPRAALSPDATEALLGYSWPGNVRELRAELIHAFAMAGSGGPITPSCFQFPGHPSPSGRTATGGPPSLRRRIDEVEEAAIIDAIRMAGGNKSEAARRLGLTRRTLYRRLQAMSAKVGGTLVGDAAETPAEA